MNYPSMQLLYTLVLIKLHAIYIMRWIPGKVNYMNIVASKYFSRNSC